MSQHSPKLDGIQRLLEAGLLVMCLMAMYLMLALFSFDPADPGWSQTGYQTPIRNLGGPVGAYISDVLLNVFGWVGYALPFVLAAIGWMLFRKYHQLMQLDYLTLGLKVIGGIMLFIGITAIASMNFDDLYYFSAGGILGDMLSTSLMPYLSFVGTTLLFLMFILAGFVLLTGVSLFTIVDGTGHYTIKACLTLIALPALIKEKYGVSPEAESKNDNEIPAHSVSEEQPESIVNEYYVDSSQDGTAKVEPTLEKVTTSEPQIFAESENDVSFEDEQVEPFVAIDDLIGEPLAINVQEHVSEQELEAAFEDVEPINVQEKPAAESIGSLQSTEEEPDFLTMPSIDLLDRPDKAENPIDQEQLEQVSRLVEAKLAEFGVKADVVGVFPGPVITRFELDLAPGVKVSKISNLSKDLARSLSAKSVRVVEVIPGKSVIGLELPNKYREIVYLRDVLNTPEFDKSASSLTMAIGQDIAGEAVIVDLAKMPHLLVAGTTGSGKSVAINTMILSLLYKSTPEDVRMIMIDPKMLELSVYEGIPHLLSEVVTDMKEASNALRWCVGEMERRYKLMSALGVRNLKGYNQKILKAKEAGEPLTDPLWQPTDAFTQTPPVLDKLPSIVVVVDEFADMMMIVGKKVEELIARIAQKARAAGIHLVLATQRPSVDVITGLIKANIPTRMALQVSSRIDSRTILDQQGAEQLLGHGDMFYLPPGSGLPTRVHGAFVDDHEVHAVVSDWKARGEPNYIDEILSGENEQDILLPGEQAEGEESELDALYDEALAFVTETRRVSISSIQRKFRIGYNRAARIVEDMEGQGVVSTPGHNGAREVLAPPPVKDPMG